MKSAWLRAVRVLRIVAGIAFLCVAAVSLLAFTPVMTVLEVLGLILLEMTAIVFSGFIWLGWQLGWQVSCALLFAALWLFLFGWPFKRTHWMREAPAIESCSKGE